MKRVLLDTGTQIAVAMTVQGNGEGPYTERIPCPACGGTGISKMFGDDWCGACGGMGDAWKMRDGVELSLLVVKP